MMAKSYDLAVIGAGISGLSMARTYLALHPDASIIILDESPTLGGVWATDRLYPMLKTNNMYGHFEFSDFQMTEAKVAEGQHIPGPVVNRYMQAYANRFDLTRRIKCNVQVLGVEAQSDSSWTVTVRSTDEAERTCSITASRLVVASGMTSEPVIPKLPGYDRFDAPLFHSREFAARSQSLEGIRDAVVLSGAKSAWDVAYSLATTGVQVHWVIRRSGFGPCYMAPSRVTPAKILAERLITTRLVTMMSPCVWGAADGYHNLRMFLNSTWIGRKLMRQFTKQMQAGLIKDNNYDLDPETAKLKPNHDLFWVGTGRGLLNYDSSIFELVRSGKIKIYAEDVAHLSQHTVHLADDQRTVIPAEALICCTGWQPKPSISFLRNGADISAELGLPHHSSEPQSSMEVKADKEIFARLPILRDQPVPNRHLTLLKPHDRDQQDVESGLRPATRLNQPYLLYRFMVPPAHIHTRTIAFAGIVRSASTMMIAQKQALWITAFFDHSIPHLNPSKEVEASTLRPGRPSLYPKADSKKQPPVAPIPFDENIIYETTLHARNNHWRYPYGYGSIMPDFMFDALPYMDLMLAELGLQRWRKGSWIRELTESYSPRDYEGLLEEWQDVQGREGEGQNKDIMDLPRTLRGVEKAFGMLLMVADWSRFGLLVLACGWVFVMIR